MGFWPSYKHQMWTPSFGAGHKPNQRTFGYLHNRRATIVPFCLAAWYCSLYGSWVYKITDVFSPRSLHSIVLDHEIYQKKESFQLSYSLSSLYHAAEVCGIFTTILTLTWKHKRSQIHKEILSKPHNDILYWALPYPISNYTEL